MKGKVLKETVQCLDDRRIFVSGLCKTVEESLLLSTCSQLCEIENLYIIKRDQANSNIAYITLKYQADVQKLLNTKIALQGKKIHLVQYQRKEA